MVDIKAFVPADLDWFIPTEAERVSNADWRTAARSGANFGPAWTAWIDGRAVACGGIATLWRGRGQAWCLLARGIPKWAWISIHRAAVARLREAGARGTWRIEAEALADYAPAVRWLEMLGFTRECLSRRYGPGGEDFYRYAIVRVPT